MLRNGRYFLFEWALAFVAAVVVAFRFDRIELHKKLNELHSESADFIFKWITYLGDGAIAAIISVVLFFVKMRTALMFTTAWVMAGLTTQFFKRLVFADQKRPGAVFKDDPTLYVPDGIELNMSNSFPSGHSTVIFAMCCTFALLSGKRWIETLLFWVAVIVAYSRVYLSQHFFGDIVAGSLVGVVWAFFAFAIWRRIDKKWLDKSLVELVKK